MRNRVIIPAFLAIGAIAVAGGYFVMPTDECERCFEKLNKGMNIKDADRILNEHGFCYVGGMASGPDEMWSDYVHKGEKRTISFSVLYLEVGPSNDRIHRKTMHPREGSAIRRFIARLNIQ